MTANLGLDLSRECSPANHSPDIGLEHKAPFQLAGTSASGSKQRILPFACDVGSADVLFQVSVEIVVSRHLVLLAALFVQPDPSAPPLYIEILDFHGNGGSHPGEGIDHEPDESAVSQPEQGSDVDGIQQQPGLVGLEDGSLAPFLRMLRSADSVGRA